MKSTSINSTKPGRFSFSTLMFWLRFRMVPFFAAIFVKILALTMNFKYEFGQPVEDLIRDGKRIILAFYHRRLIMMPAAYPLKHFMAYGKRRGIAILSSSSKDGELSAETWRWFGIHAIRGTASQNGAKALIRLIRAVKDGWDLGITVDGPRGPRGQVKGGILTISRKTGSWIVPVCVAYDRAWKLHSWDEMLIPKPFSSAIVRYGVPFMVPTDSDMESLRVQVETNLDEMEDWAERMGS